MILYFFYMLIYNEVCVFKYSNYKLVHIDGVQSESYDNVDVTWSYDKTNGLVVIYEVN